MNWLDVILLIVMIVATLIGLKIGLIKAVFSFAGLVVGIVLAGRFYPVLADKLTFIPGGFAKIAAFAIILIAVMLIAAIGARMLGWFISKIMLGWLNHLGGAFLGLMLGVIFCSVLLAIWAKFLGADGPIASSGLAKLLLGRFPLILALLPGDFRSFFQ